MNSSDKGKKETPDERNDAASKEKKPEPRPDDTAAGPMGRGGSLELHEVEGEEEEQASDDSFPASDAPSFGPVTGS